MKFTRTTGVFGKSIALTFLLLSIGISMFSQKIIFREFLTEMGQPYVYSFVQDNKGFLWVGTGSGLSRFDGNQFKLFTTSDSLADNFVTCSFVDNNVVWFGHMNGKLSMYDGRNFRHFHNLEATSPITGIQQMPNGELWASSFSGDFIKLNPKAEKVKKAYSNKLSVYVFRFVDNNNVLVGSINGLYYASLQPTGQLRIIKRIDGIPETKIAGIVRKRNSSGFYVATEDEGVFEVSVKNTNITCILLNTKLEQSNYKIQSLLEDSESNLWFATAGNGLMKYSISAQGKFDAPEVFNISNGFSTDYVKTVFEDREGNIWTGNYGTGLTQIVDKEFNFSWDDPKYGASVSAIAFSANAKWLGTEKGILKIDKSTDKLLKFFSSAQNGFADDKITALYTFNNTLWIGTESNGLFKLDLANDKVIKVPISDGSLENSITSICSNRNQLWIGTRKGVCNINTINQEQQWYTNIKGGLPHNSVNCVYADSKERIWITTNSNVLTIINKDKLEKRVLISDQRIQALGSIVEENDSTVWVASRGSGLFRICSSSIINITTKEGLLSEFCYSLVLDDEKNLWVGHRGGLSRIRLSDLFIKHIQEYAGIKSSLEFNLNASVKNSNQQLLFGTNNGVLTYFVPQKQNLVSPTLSITSVKINDEPRDIHENLILAPGKYKLKFEFSGINLKEPSLVTYKYQLQGYDDSLQLTRLNNVVYPNLGEGDYVFKIWAFSGDGAMSTPVTFQVTVKTPLWKHWWFYLIIAVSLQVAILWYNRKNELRLIAEKTKLENKVQERTAELSKKNILLIEKQDEIITKNQELERYQNYLEDLVSERTIELEYAKNKAEESDKLKTAILNNLSHEIRTPLNAICGFSNLLEDDSLTRDQKRDFIRIINNNSDSLLYMINNLIDLSMIETNQIQFNFAQENLGQLFIDLQNHYSQYNSKKIKIISEVSGSVSCYCDLDKLKLVISNLLENAIKFTEKGLIKYGCMLEGDEIIFYVSDTGIGIQKEVLLKIFEPFEKVEDSSSKVYRGAGIGLSICKKVIEQMNGKIWVESEPNKGSIFYFTLPSKVNS